MVPLTSSLCSCPPAPRHPVPPWLAEVWHTLGHIPWSTSPAVSHQNHLILWHRVHSGHRNLEQGWRWHFPASFQPGTNSWSKACREQLQLEHPWQEAGFRTGHLPAGWVSQGESSTAGLCCSSPSLLSAMLQGHPKIQVSVVGTTSGQSLCLQVAAPVQGSVFVPGLAHPGVPPCPGAGHSPAAALPFMAQGLPGVCRDTRSRGLVPCSHKVCAKVWPLLRQHGMATQAEGLIVGSGLTS